MLRLCLLLLALTGSALACPAKPGKMANGAVPLIKAFYPVCDRASRASELSIIRGLDDKYPGSTYTELYWLEDLDTAAARALEAGLVKAGYRNRTWEVTSWGKVVTFEHPRDYFSVLRIVYVTARGGSVLVALMDD